MLVHIVRPCTRHAARICPAVAGTGICRSVKVRFYTPPVSTRGYAGDPAASAPSELLDTLQPQQYSEALASIIDSELDYDSDLGTASINNIEAAMRAKLADGHKNMTHDQVNEYLRRNIG